MAHKPAGLQNCLAIWFETLYHFYLHQNYQVILGILLLFSPLSPRSHPSSVTKYQQVLTTWPPHKALPARDDHRRITSFIATDTLPETNTAPENRYWKPPFLGAMLVLESVYSRTSLPSDVAHAVRKKNSAYETWIRWKASHTCQNPHGFVRGGACISSHFKSCVFPLPGGPCNKLLGGQDTPIVWKMSALVRIWHPWTVPNLRLCRACMNVYI